MTPHLSLPAIVSKSACAALLALAAASTAFAQGSDNASNYSGNWSNGSNQGTGFGGWNLYISGNGSSGHFIGNSTAQGFGDVNSNGVAFAMYGNPAGDNYSNAERSFSAPLVQGQSFSIKLAIAYRNGSKGISLFSGSGFGSEVWNFNVGGDKYTTGGVDQTTWAFSQTSIFTLTANQTTSNTINITLTRDSDTYSTTVNGTLGGFRLYVGSTDAGNDLNNLFFNDLQITGNASVTPTIISPASANGTVGAGFTYQITTAPASTSYNATGLPGGLTLNSTSGLISGTPSAAGNSSVTLTATNSVGTGSPFTLNLTFTLPSAPTVNTGSYTVGATGSLFNYQLSSSPAVTTTYNATGLPPGLSLNSTTGLISGTPSATGTSSVNITATNAGGTSSPTALTIAIGTSADAARNYSGNWTTGSNAGSGFGSWTITSNSGTNGFAGTFLGNPASAQITGMGDPSFGLFANPPDSGAFASAERSLNTPLSQGQSLSFQWGINWDSGAGNSTVGNKGFSLFTASGETLVVNNSNSANITVESKTNNSTETSNLQYGSAAMLWTFTQTTNSSVTITATPRGPGSVYTTSLPTSGEITSIRFYASNMQNGDNAQPYFNNFLITGGSTPVSAYDSWASSYGLNATVTTGPTAGAPTADPDADSFTNQQEYAFGTNPTLATAGLLTSSSGASGLTVVFLTRSNLTYNVQTTDNLSTTAFSNNATVTGEVITSSDQSGVPSGYIRKQFTIVPSGSRNFYRVVASEQAPG
jgi:hypothetical protein